MRKDWFEGCRTAEEGKKLYRQLAKKFHPDVTGEGETMKAINNAFTAFWAVYKDIHMNAETKQTYTSTKRTTETAQDFIDIISKLSSIETEIEVEICGSWLWITGNTYPVKDQLTSFGCKWSKSKHKWYWTKDQFTKSRYKTKSMNAIRMMYGSEMVQLDKVVMPKLTA